MDNHSLISKNERKMHHHIRIAMTLVTAIENQKNFKTNYKEAATREFIYEGGYTIS